MTPSRKARCHTARTNRKAAKRRLKAEAKRSHSKEVPRNQRRQTNLSVPMFFTDAMHSIGFNAIRKGRAA